MTSKINIKRPSVLVLGEDTRSFLSVVRSLGQSNYDIHVVCYDRHSPALKSKYIQSVQYYNYQALTQQEWLENVTKLIERYQFDLIIPCDERAIYPLWSVRKSLPETTRLAIANQEALDALFDKWETKKVAIACDVPVARGKVVDLYSTQYQELCETFGSKFVIKPLQSFEQTKLSQRQKVAIAESEEAYLAYQKQVRPGQDYLIEAFFSGKGEGLSVLSLEGEVYAAFAHVRVAEPKSGGGSSYRKSIPLDPELLQATQAVCEQTKLTGVAMFEFRRNLKTNEWILVEVNARFWGSLPLAVYAGVDFPKLYADYLVYGQKSASPQLDYRQNVYARALIADIYEVKREFELCSEEIGKARAFAGLVLRLAQILRGATPVETIDSFALSDQKPFYSEVSLLSKSLAYSLSKKLSVVLTPRRYFAKKRLKALFEKNPNRRILFICYGNIMRSPFAEQVARRLNRDKKYHLEFDSFGFHQKEQRQSPVNAQKAAQKLGCDLTERRSQWLTQLDISETDIVVYFDEYNRDKLEAYYKVNHAFCAADFVDSVYPVSSDIDDPYGGEVDNVLGCYRQIESSVGQILRLYSEANR